MIRRPPRSTLFPTRRSSDLRAAGDRDRSDLQRIGASAAVQPHLHVSSQGDTAALVLPPLPPLPLLSLPPFSPDAAGQVDVARFFTVLAVMLLVGKFAGELFERLRQPAVMGELLAGIVLGAGFLKVIPMAPGDPLTPVFRLLAQVGVVVLLFEIGLDTELDAMKRVGAGAAAVAVVGVAVPFVAGVLYWRSGGGGGRSGEHTAGIPSPCYIVLPPLPFKKKK